MRILPSGWIDTLTKLDFKSKRKSSKSTHGALHRPLRFETLDDRRMLATITVNTLIDIDSATDGVTTLREAVVAAAPAGDTINFTSNLNAGVIALDQGLGQIETEGKSVTINASMLPLGITINAGGGTDGVVGNGDGIRIFNVTDPTFGSAPPSVTMIGLTLTGGDVPDDGGAIRSEGMVVLRNSTLRDNRAASGGAIFVQVAGSAPDRSVLQIEDSMIENNVANEGGGVAIISGNGFASTPDAIAITRTTIRDNQASISGGGVFARLHGASMTLASSTVTGNDGGIGGALYARLYDVDLTVDGNSVISGNLTTNPLGEGGGLWLSAGNQSHIRVQDSTLSGNDSEAHGGGLRVALAERSSLVVDNSTISGNDSGGDGGGLYVNLSDSSVALTSSTISGNSAQGDGGGLFARASQDLYTPFPSPRAVTISQSLVSGNTASNRGGGVYTYNLGATETLVEDSRITGNHVPYSFSGFLNGGGIYAFINDNSGGVSKPKFTISRSTVDNNDAYHEGGGIFLCSKNGGNFVATNSTISGNRTVDPTAGGGGGIMIARTNGPNRSVDADLRNLTITQNSSISGGGIKTKDLTDVRVRIANSIVSENFDLPDPLTRVPNNLVGRLDISSAKYNLVGTGSSVLDLNGQSAMLDATNIISDAPMLNPLASNGGPTPTHAPQSGSPVIDEGSNDLARDPLTGVALTTDQRGPGFTRPYDVVNVDIGAYEIGLAKVINVTISGSTSTHAPFSYDDPTNDAADFDGSGLQLRTVPVGSADTVAIQFSEHVTNVVDGSLSLTGLLTGATPQVAMDDGFDYDPTTRIATWKFSAALTTEQYVLSLPDSLIGPGGLALDGEWTNPGRLYVLNSMPPVFFTDASISTFPSGDGLQGGGFNFVMTILPGDADLNNFVGSPDLALLLTFFNTYGQDFQHGDFNGLVQSPGTQSQVNSSDLSLLLVNFNKDLRTVRLADVNLDGEVDGVDLGIINDNFGITGATHAHGDVDGDGDVDGNDQLLWQRHLGLQVRIVL